MTGNHDAFTRSNLSEELERILRLNLGTANVIRYGKHNNPESYLHQSNAEHVYNLNSLLWFFQRKLNNKFPSIDWVKTFKMSHIHDVVENLTGDVLSPIKNDKDKAVEVDSIPKIVHHVPNEILYETTDLLWEYEEGKTIESKIVKALDKLEAQIYYSSREGMKEILELDRKVLGLSPADSMSMFKKQRDWLIQNDLGDILELYELVWELQVSRGILKNETGEKIEDDE